MTLSEGPCSQSNLFYLYLFLRDNRCTMNKIHNARKVYSFSEVFLLTRPFSPQAPSSEETTAGNFQGSFRRSAK